MQIAVFTERITYLQTHIKTHRKDHHTKRGLLQLVSDRRRMLKYLKRKDEARFVLQTPVPKFAHAFIWTSLLQSRELELLLRYSIFFRAAASREWKWTC